MMGKFIVRNLMQAMVFLYRATKGKFGGRMAGMNVLLLTTTGRKTGQQRTTPLGFFEDQGGYVIIASNAGSDLHPAWYHNLKSNPRASIEINDKRYDVSAEITSPEKRDQLWAKLIQFAPSYRGYEKKTNRVIPIVILRPTSA